MGTEVQVLFCDVKEARKFVEEATNMGAFVRVGLIPLSGGVPPVVPSGSSGRLQQAE